MDTQTFLTIILSSIFGGGIAVAAYAMTIPSAIEPKLAKRALLTAWVAGEILCVWYGGTNEMIRWGRYSLAGLLAAALTIALCFALEHIKEKETAQTEVKDGKPDTKLAISSPTIADASNLKASLLFDNQMHWKGGDAKLEITLINDTSRSAIVRGVYLVQRMFDDPSFRGGEKFSLMAFEDPNIGSPLLMLQDDMNGMRYKDGSIVYVWKAKTTLINEAASVSSYVSIPPGQTARIDLTFPSIDVSNEFNISVLLPIFNLIQDDGSSVMLICKGSDIFLVNFHGPGDGGLIVGPKQRNYILSPRNENKNCRMVGS